MAAGPPRGSAMSADFRRGRRRRHEGNPNPPEGNQNISERNPSRSRTNSKSGGTKSKFKSLRFVSLFRGLRRDAHSILHFCSIPASNVAGNVRVRLGLFVSSVFVSGSSDLFKQVKGWRLFTIADGVFARRLGAVSARPHGRGAWLRQKGNPAPTDPRGYEPGDRGPAEKDRPIDPMCGKEYARLNKSPNRCRAFGSGRAPALHACEYLTNACL